MAIYNISSNTNVGTNTNDDNDTYIVDAGVTVNVAADDAFFGGSSFTGNKFDIYGSVISAAPDFAFNMQANKTSIVIRTTGSVTTDGTAIWMRGAEAGVVNRGTIDAVDYGVKIDGNASFTKNKGTLNSDDVGIFVSGRGGEIENYGVINAAVGVESAASSGQGFALFNASAGTITGSQYAFEGGLSNDLVLNKGQLNGDVLLGGGKDVFDNRGGNLNGDVYGGGGNDIYKIDAANVKPIEMSNEGTDKVVSSVSYKLGSNIENLQLTGSSNIKGTGNGADNALTGNNGNNKLIGSGGEDSLAGGRGNDVLKGGGDSDVFIFAKNSGKDEIVDFKATGGAHDVIDLSHVSQITNFNDLKNNHMDQDGSDVVIHIKGSHEITIDGVKIGTLDAGDFIF